jgi:hypothetical protein
VHRVGGRGKGIIKAEDNRHMIDGTTGKLMGITGIYCTVIVTNVNFKTRIPTASNPQLKPRYGIKITSNLPHPALGRWKGGVSLHYPFVRVISKCLIFPVLPKHLCYFGLRILLPIQIQVLDMEHPKNQNIDSP